MLLLLCALSAGIAGQLGVSAGAERTANDPFVIRRGARVGVSWAPTPTVRFGLSGAWFPNLGEADLQPTTRQFVEELHLAPDISRMMAQARAELWVLPFVHPIGRLRAATGAYTGFGGVYTQEDLEWFIPLDDPEQIATRDQLHPTTTWGLCSELGNDRVRGRLRIERTTYIETVSSIWLQMKGNLIVALELSVWTGS
jgi:hypothetical protein